MINILTHIEHLPINNLHSWYVQEWGNINVSWYPHDILIWKFDPWNHRLDHPARSRRASGWALASDSEKAETSQEDFRINFAKRCKNNMMICDDDWWMDGVCSLDVDVDTSFPTPSLPSPKIWKPFGIIALVEVGLSNLLGETGKYTKLWPFCWEQRVIIHWNWGTAFWTHPKCPFWANWLMFRPRNVELNLFSEKKLLGAQPNSKHRTPHLADHQLLYWITTILRIYTPFSDTAIFFHMIETKYSEICSWTVGFLNVKRGSRNWHLYP